MPSPSAYSAPVLPSPDFRTLWKQVRAQIDRGKAIEPEDIKRLESVARSTAEEAMIGSIEILSGAYTHDVSLHDAGLFRLRHESPVDLAIALDALPDLATLGFPRRRVRLVRTVLQHMLGDDHPIVNLLIDGSTTRANDLQERGLSDLAVCSRAMARETRRQIGWTCLYGWTATRDRVYLTLFDATESVDDDGAEWEGQLLRSLIELSNGQLEEATTRISTLLPQLPARGWQRRRVARSMTAFAHLASPHVEQWLRLIPGTPFATHHAVDMIESVGSTVCYAVGQPRRRTTAVPALHGELQHRAAECFLLFIQFPGSVESNALAEILLRRLEHTPTDAIALPWPNRQAAFARACRDLPDRSVAFRLLARTVALAGSSVLDEALVDMLDAAPAADLATVPTQWLQSLFAAHVDRLSPATQQMIRRGLVYRVIIDGSNVCLVGQHGRYNRASIRYYEQAVDDLRAAGFRDIVTFFDASTRHRMEPAEWRLIEELEAERYVQVVRGEADPYIIDAFLEAPQSTWIVTADDYVDPMRRKPALQPYWFSHRLHFHVGRNDRIHWGRAMDSPELPVGAPQRPRVQRGSRR